METAKSESFKALAMIKCEPTWYKDGKQYFLYETAPSYIKTIESALTNYANMVESLEGFIKEYKNDLRLHRGNLSYALGYVSEDELFESFIADITKVLEGKK
jgi:hypothetical protein